MEAEGGGVIIKNIIINQTRARKIKSNRRGHAASQGIGTSSPAKEIWLNPKYHLGGKFTTRLSS